MTCANNGKDRQEDHPFYDVIVVYAYYEYEKVRTHFAEITIKHE
jgi:hypothetical protein